MKSRYIDESEIIRLRNALTIEEWLPLWVSLETGLRVGDVVKMERKDLREDGLHYVAEKTGKKGIAKVSQRLRKVLSQRRGKYIFPSFKSGKHLTRQAVWQRIKRAGKRAGIDLEGVSPHSMRKAFAVELYREKGFKVVQEALQHTNTATTEIYSFADWDTGDNANLPLCRKDLKLVVRMVLEALGDNYHLPKESIKKG